MTALYPRSRFAGHERACIESLAILLEASHGNDQARERHCQEAASIIRRLVERVEQAESLVDQLRQRAIATGRRERAGR